jgi:hypothetical protein
MIRSTSTYVAINRAAIASVEKASSRFRRLERDFESACSVNRAWFKKETPHAI